ncbi:hypothetical protein [Litchfieldella rifensis]|uniref:Uncharacterized protein n=1 Tax=Litchfieldella rifensis TaxID=762643 RepID=A0ABV7LIT1_9GAMM
MPFPALPLPRVQAQLIRFIDPRVPLALKRRLVEPMLNRTFAEPLLEGEVDGVSALVHGTLQGRQTTTRKTKAWPATF